MARNQLLKILLTEGSSSSARQTLYGLDRFTVDVADPPHGRQLLTAGSRGGTHRSLAGRGDERVVRAVPLLNSFASPSEGKYALAIANESYNSATLHEAS